VLVPLRIHCPAPVFVIPIRLPDPEFTIGPARVLAAVLLPPSRSVRSSAREKTALVDTVAMAALLSVY